MTDIERGPGREAPPEGEARPETPSTPEDRAAGAEARAEAGERQARGETNAERREAKERIADVLWAKPKHFVERVIKKNVTPYLRRFLGKFGSLDDSAMTTDALKKTRDEAKRAAGEPEQR